MKIKMIDLLSKIANNEEVPKKIKYKNFVYGWVWKYKTYIRYDITGKELYITTNNLNDEVEIIEEDKKIEKLPYYSLEKIQKSKNKDEWHENRLELLEKRINDYHNKINELIDEVNKLKEK